ncbi:MAG: rRNA pseudouridine synthase [Lachnospiraceae bacterium]|nr:rRNA pseudouridine synthase [Lachnospiraceae bacterium]
MAVIRLDKFLADAGAGTRSAVKALVRQGRVTINDKFVKKSDIKVDTDRDIICLDGKELTYNEYEYFMLNKPKGVVSATTDAKDKTVVELITEHKRRDIFPIGRLDKDTEGLLILSNDGKLANALLAPNRHVDKRYFAIIDGIVSEDTVNAFNEGIDIGDDKPTLPARLIIRKSDTEKDSKTEDNIDKIKILHGISEIEIIITEGRYHQIKRMFEAVGMKVTYLKRLSMGNIKLDEGLKPGEYRRLTEEEINLLKDSLD